MLGWIIVRKLLIIPGMIVFIFLFSELYKHQLGSIGYFLLALLFFNLAKRQFKRYKIREKRVKSSWIEEKSNNP